MEDEVRLPSCRLTYTTIDHLNATVDCNRMGSRKKRQVAILPTVLLLAVFWGAATCFACAERGARTPSEPPPGSAAFLQPGSSFLTPDQVKPLELSEIFGPRDLSPLPLDPNRLRVLLATGDVMPARQTDSVIRSRKDDFSYPFAATKKILADADLTVINLEAPLIKRCPARGPRFQFCGRPGFARALKDAGVDVVTLENNHIANYGKAGVTETIRHLEAAHLVWVDRRTPAILKVRDLSFGFLAFNGVGKAIDRPKTMARIQALRPQVDILVAAFHWGAEYVQL
ncbi:MAG: CapA family protein, partial [candidate division NC10 bacterium]|nr:CapA family protein [candidate division NC10 bacterium]